MNVPEPALNLSVSPHFDIEALAALNPDLANQALAQIYADGDRDLCLAWAGRLDIFKSCSLRRDPIQSPPSPLSIRAGYFYSLFDLAMDAADRPFLDQLIEDEKTRRAIFQTRFDSVCAFAAKMLASQPEFATYLVDRLDPLPATDPSYSYRHLEGGLEKLVVAASKAKLYSWLPRLGALHQIFYAKPLSGGPVLRECFLDPVDVQGAATLFDMDCVNFERWHELALLFCSNASPEVQALGLRVAELDFDRSVQDSKTDASHPNFSRVHSNSALAIPPHKTPPILLEFYLKLGVDPFACDPLASASIGVKLFGEDWRDKSIYFSASALTASTIERVRIARAQRENALLPLLALMLAHAKTPPNEHFDVGALGLECQKIFAGARKIDLLALCVGQGFYRCADALVRHGVDWKFAAKQCDQWLRKAFANEENEIKAISKSYFDAVALRAVSTKASAKRDRLLASSEPEVFAPSAPPAPNTARRL